MKRDIVAWLKSLSRQKQIDIYKQFFAASLVGGDRPMRLHQQALLASLKQICDFHPKDIEEAERETKKVFEAANALVNAICAA